MTFGNLQISFVTSWNTIFFPFFCRHETITNHNHMVQFCGVDECTSAYSTPNCELVRTLALHKKTARYLVIKHSYGKYWKITMSIKTSNKMGDGFQFDCESPEGTGAQLDDMRESAHGAVEI